MILKKIELFNFRNYEAEKINLKSGINIFFGNNAQGKTNILESIYVLAITKSHRIIYDGSLIKHESNFFRIKGEVELDDEEKSLELSFNGAEKKVKIDDIEIKKLSDYVTSLNVIMFCPDDLELVKGSPSTRRNYINVQLGQISKNYIKILSQYNKILKIRNEYLRTLVTSIKHDSKYLDIITDELIERAIKIYQVRNDFIGSINKYITNIYRNITGEGELIVKYESTQKFLNYDGEHIRKELKEKFISSYEREIQQVRTLYGPHKDDIVFRLDDKEIKDFGSQGQQRVAILSLKIAEIEIFKDKTGNYPILLLDDIFSELDSNKINNLLSYLEGDYQIIMTTTDFNSVNNKILKNANLYKVENGKIVENKEVI